MIREFSADYLRQTNLLLGEGTLDGAENLVIFDASQFPTLAPAPLIAPAVAAPAAEEKEKRKKRAHDPNAPKRPLTPYFLYMQTARPIIASDLGEEAPKGAVQAEGQRRWGVMSKNEKTGWNHAYQYNLRLYNARMHSYKNGNQSARLMTDPEALKYADEMNIEMPAVSGLEDPAANDQAAIAEQLQQAVGEEDATANKTPKKPGPKGGKRKTGTPAGGDVDVAKASAATPASPDRKRKRTSTKPDDAAAEPKKGGRKKTKSG